MVAVTIAMADLWTEALLSIRHGRYAWKSEMRLEVTNYIRFDSNKAKGVAIMAKIHDETILPFLFRL